MAQEGSAFKTAQARIEDRRRRALEIKLFAGGVSSLIFLTGLFYFFGRKSDTQSKLDAAPLESSVKT